MELIFCLGFIIFLVIGSTSGQLIDERGNQNRLLSGPGDRKGHFWVPRAVSTTAAHRQR